VARSENGCFKYVRGTELEHEIWLKKRIKGERASQAVNIAKRIECGLEGFHVSAVDKGPQQVLLWESHDVGHCDLIVEEML
jgi:hypothetical protein